MSRGSIGLDDRLTDYVREVGVREHPVLAALRERTAELPNADMQISPEQGAFMALMVRAMGARRILEVGTFTGYSSTAMALALPPDGRMVCCDVSEEWTDIARQAWTDAGVADRVDLRLGPAVETLEALGSEGQAGSFDLAFIDADKVGYDAYYEGALRLLRAGGVILIDNVLRGGAVVESADQDEGTRAIKALNAKIAADERVEVAMTPIGDGLTLALVR